MASRIKLVDVGASGGIHSRWESISDLTVIGFEPDEREFIKLKQSRDRIWFNIALSDKTGIENFYVTHWQTNTSLFKPNIDLIRMLALNEQDFEVLREVRVPCNTLDEVLNEKGIQADVLKIDTQGSELKILNGSKNQLQDSILAVESEVEFVELYRDQPLFAELDQFMRASGFQLIDIGNLCYVKGAKSRGIGGRKGQLISADALYFKPIDSTVKLIIKANDPEKKLMAIAKICLVYGYPDYVIEVVDRLQGKVISHSKLSSLVKLMKTERIRSPIPHFRGKGFLYRISGKLAWLFEEYRDGYWLFPLGNRE